MLTARGAETDRVVGLEMGADDYVAKPFSPREVVARVAAVLRRGRDRTNPPPAPPPLSFGDLEIDLRAREVAVERCRVSLTPKEFDLLAFLARNPRTAFSRLQLLEEVWDVASDCDPSTVTVHIRRLREKIEADPSPPHHLRTVWGSGTGSSGEPPSAARAHGHGRGGRSGDRPVGRRGDRHAEA
jgi:DNA-binding response OmpR family regulator